MKIAVVYSTQLRTGLRCIENHRRFFGNLHVDTFAHLWNWNTSRLYEDLQPVPSEELQEYLRHIDVKKYQIENRWMEFPESLYYSWARSVHLKREWEIETGTRYDVVVKLRPDIIFPPNRFLLDEVNKVLRKGNIFLVEGLQPDWMVPGGFCDDVIWVSTDGIMDFAASYYDFNYRTGGNKPPHKSLARFLYDNGINIENTHGYSIDGGFCVYRPEATHLNPMSQFRECSDVNGIYVDVPSPKPGTPEYS